MFPWTTAAPDSQASDAEESVESVYKGLEVESEELMSMLHELRMDEFSNRASNLLHHSQSQRRTQMPPQIATATLVVNAPPVPPMVSRCEVTQVAAEDEIVEPTVVAPLPPIEQPRARASRQRVQAIPGRSESSGPSVPTSNDATVALWKRIFPTEGSKEFLKRTGDLVVCRRKKFEGGKTEKKREVRRVYYVRRLNARISARKGRVDANYKETERPVR